MEKRVVGGPDGRTWVVRRRWVPRLGQDTLWGLLRRQGRTAVRRARGMGEGLGDIAGEGCIATLEDVAVGLVLVVGALVLFVVVVPLLATLVDLVVLLLVALVGLGARIVFRRPWIVEARADDGTVHRWRVVGWRASEEGRDEIAQMLTAGVVPPADETKPGVT